MDESGQEAQKSLQVVRRTRNLLYRSLGACHILPFGSLFSKISWDQNNDFLNESHCKIFINEN